MHILYVGIQGCFQEGINAQNIFIMDVILLLHVYQKFRYNPVTNEMDTECVMYI